MKIIDAQQLLQKYVSSATLSRHSLTVCVAMQFWAKELGVQNDEFWACVGLLHDIDFEQYPNEHCVKAKEILNAEKQNYPDITDEFIHAVQSHGWGLCCDVEPVHLMEKVLYTIDELTGLIFACAMARPSRSVMDLEVKSVLKKFKIPAFAAGCSRDVITRGMDMMKNAVPTLSDEEIIQKTILAMRTRAAELGVGMMPTI